MHAYDFQEPYLRAIFGFVGVRDMAFIHAQPMDILPDLGVAALDDAIRRAKALAATWAAAATVVDLRDVHPDTATGSHDLRAAPVVVAEPPH